MRKTTERISETALPGLQKAYRKVVIAQAIFFRPFRLSA